MTSSTVISTPANGAAIDPAHVLFEQLIPSTVLVV